MDVVKQTREMNRVPVILRTPKNPMHLQDVKPYLATAFNLPYTNQNDVCELNLRQLFAESFGNPVKKTEQRDKINQLVKKALLQNKVLLLNFDDYTYPEALQEQLHKLDKAAGEQHEGQAQKVQSVSNDPNLKEFSGTKAFPDQFWHPLDVCQNRELLE